MSYDFNGTDTILTGAITPPTSTGSVGEVVAAWVRPESAGEANNGAILDNESGGGVPRAYLRIRDSGRTLLWTIDNATTDAFCFTNEALTLDRWTCVVAAYDDATKIVSVFFGTETTPMREATYASRTTGAGIWQTGASLLIIGNRSSGINTWDGQLMHVAIEAVGGWTYAEMERYRLTGRPPLRPNPAFNTVGSTRGWWPLTHDLLDRSGMGVTLTASPVGAVSALEPNLPGLVYPGRGMRRMMR